MKKAVRLFLSMVLVLCLSALPVYAEVITPDTFSGSETHITSINIGSDVTEIQDGSFSNLKNLTSISVSEKNPYYASCQGCLYNKDYTQLICIPQNTTVVKVKKTIRSYTEHALDGLAPNRKATVDNYLSSITNTNNVVTIGDMNATPTPSVPQQNTETQEAQPEVQNPEPSQPQNDTPSSSNFSQYVYEEGGFTCFKYTGTGESIIVVPEGVQKVKGFTPDFLTYNSDITTIYLPSTLLSMTNSNLFCNEDHDWDTNGYNCLYSCTNLKTVHSSSPYYISGSGGLYRPLAGGSTLYVWSPSSKIVYDKSKYYETGSIQ